MTNFASSQPRKILFLTVQNLWGNSHAPQGAPGKTLTAYIDAGFSISIISTNRINERYASLCPDGVFKTVLPFAVKWPKNRTGRLFVYGFLFPFFAAWYRFIRYRQEHYDLVYGYEVHGVLAGKLISILSRTALVARFQGTVLSPIFERDGRLRERVLRLDHFIAMMVRADVAIMTDDGTHGDRVYRKLNHGRTPRFAFWRNGVDRIDDVDQARNLREEIAIQPDAPVVMTLSRLARWKRVDRAIRIFAMADIPDDARLCIVGDGKERESLEALTISLGKESNVIFLGHVPHAKAVSLLRQADVFLSFYDLSNLGNPIFEAMRTGTALITLDTGDTASVVRHGENGIILKKWEETVAARHLSQLLRDSDYRKKIGNGAFRYADKHFLTWNARMKREIQFITDTSWST